MSIAQLICYLGLSLSRLRIIEVTNCPRLKYLLWYGNARLNTKMLEVIEVSFCEKLKQLFEHNPVKTEAPVSVIPNLRIKEVINCNALRVLPLSDLNENTIQEIRGDELWWSILEQGSDNNTKECLQSFFRPVKAEIIQPEIYRG